MEHSGFTPGPWKAGELPNVASLLAENERLRALLGMCLEAICQGDSDTRTEQLDELRPDIRAALAAKGKCTDPDCYSFGCRGPETHTRAALAAKKG